MSKRRSKQRSRQRGGSLVEMALMLPWYLFFFVGTYDWGFYAHALISTESAARVAAEYTSQSSTQAANQATACILANEELRTMNNVSVTGTPTCAASPLIVTAAQARPRASKHQQRRPAAGIANYTAVYDGGIDSYSRSVAR